MLGLWLHACLLLSAVAAHLTRFVSFFEGSPRCLFVLIFYFLVATDAEPLFVSLMAVHVSFSEKHLFRSFVCFPTELLLCGH